MPRRPATQVPGEKHPHDDFEEIWVEVLHQEHLARTIARLDREIEKDERRARNAAPASQEPPRRKPAADARPKARARTGADVPHPRSRATRTRKANGSGPAAQASNVAGLFILFSAAFIFTVAGGLFAAAVKVVRLLA